MKEPSSQPWDGQLWSQLIDAEQDEICTRTGAAALASGFSLSFVSRPYRIELDARTIHGPQAEDPELQLLLLNYLLRAQAIPLQDRWISEKEIPGGSLFFQGPHRLPDTALCARFGTDRGAFDQICIALEGRPLEYGDSSFELQVLPRIKLGLVLWLADDEFPARFSYLFTPCIHQHLPLDVIFALANVISNLLTD